VACKACAAEVRQHVEVAATMLHSSPLLAPRRGAAAARLDLFEPGADRRRRRLAAVEAAAP